MKTSLKPKRTKRRLETPKKQYALTDCALYAIRGKSQLLTVLGWHGTFAELETLANNANNYKCWSKDGRPVQEARPHLRKLHHRIATLLGRVAVPCYRHSGVKRRSFLTNALQHAVEEPILQFDIRKFYPSTTFKHVYNLFRFELNCAADISHLMARLCCFQERHLPTGGVHSEIVAFYAHKKRFDEIEARAIGRGGRVSTYVDDVTITAPNISLTDLEWIRKRMKLHQLTLHPGKSFVLKKTQPRTITGIRMAGTRAFAPSHQRMRIKELSEAFSKAESADTARSIARRLVGHYDHIAQIEGGFRAVAQGNRARLKHLLD